MNPWLLMLLGALLVSGLEKNTALGLILMAVGLCIAFANTYERGGWQNSRLATNTKKEGQQREANREQE